MFYFQSLSWTLISSINGWLLFLIFVYIIYIIYHRKCGIIKNAGLSRILLFSIGIQFYFFSCTYITYSNFLEYSLFFIYKNVGISLSISVLLIYIGFTKELSVSNKRFSFKMMGATSSIQNSNFYDNNNYNEQNNYNPVIYKFNINNENSENNKNNNEDSKKSDNSFLSGLTDDESNDDTISRIRRARSFFLEVNFVFLIYIIIIILIIMHKLRKENIETNSYLIDSGEWSYKSGLEVIDLSINIFHFLLFIVIILKGKELITHECIFKFIKYIYISAYVGVAFGPLMNVNIRIIFIN